MMYYLLCNLSVVAYMRKTQQENETMRDGKKAIIINAWTLNKATNCRKKDTIYLQVIGI